MTYLRRTLQFIFTTLIISAMSLAHADTVYQEPDAFVAEALGNTPPVSFLWLTPALQDGIRPLLGHPYPQARVRYWRANDTSVFILEEIGKEFPITAGFVIRNARIVRASVLVYRETRGGDVRLPVFVNQFDGVGLDATSGKLTRPIDGIAGATLSSGAMQRMAKTAIYLAGQLP
jgi:hypothetical protein